MCLAVSWGKSPQVPLSECVTRSGIGFDKHMMVASGRFIVPDGTLRSIRVRVKSKLNGGICLYVGLEGRAVCDVSSENWLVSEKVELSEGMQTFKVRF